MSRKSLKAGVAIFIFFFFLIGVMELDAFARVGGGMSSGSRGSRSFSSPSQPYSGPSQTRPSTAPSQPMSPQVPVQQPSIWRSLAMGMAGGFLGSLLFGGLSHGMGMDGFGGSGIGFLDIILIGGMLYILFRFLKRRKEAESTAGYNYQTGSPGSTGGYTGFADASRDRGSTGEDVQTGLRHIQQMDPTFDEARYKDQCMDSFFKIQGSWINRDMTVVKNILTEEMFNIFQKDAGKLKAEKKINKLDNIAVRSVEITEAWQESGMDFITVRFLASLLDYTVSENGELLSGSKTEPVKFEEYWTFTRPVGNNAWQLSAINQAD